MGLTVNIRKVLPGFTLETAFSSEDKILGLLGGSGSGKSMTLKCIAGLLRPDEGHIELDGRVLFDSVSGIDLPPQQRKTGYLFQHYALFPNMTVERNILCGMDRRSDRETVRELLERFHLSGMGGRYPHELSGGQQQRAALARILASQPQAILLDEPFSALDAYLREEMQLTVAQMLQSYPGIAVIVSHDRDEIYRLCDSIAVYDNGRVVRMGSRGQVFDQPQTRAAAILTGCRNVVAAHACGPDTVQVDGWGTALHTVGPTDVSVRAIGVRAHYLRPVDRAGENTLDCRVDSVVESPFEMIVYLHPLQGTEHVCWKVDKATFAKYKACTRILLHVPQDAVLLLRDEGR